MNATDRALLEQIAAGQAAILAELRALKGAIERNPRRDRPPEIGLHLQAVAAVVEGRVFSVNELVEHAAISDALRAAIIGLVGAVNGKRLGKLLRVIEGEEIGGLRVERLGVDRLGVLWRLRVCGFQNRKPAPAVALPLR